MTADELAALHAKAMDFPAPWSAQAFTELLASPGAFVCGPPDALADPSQGLSGFAMGRVVLDEAELLTLAVEPDFRRQGIGRACLSAFEAQARKMGADHAFLEVAATNTAALALYASQGWITAGRRPGYYQGDGVQTGRIDAILMRKAPI